MKAMKTLKVNIPVSTFLRNAYFSPHYVRVAAHLITRDYDTYKNLYISSVDIYNRNGNTYFNIHFSRYIGSMTLYSIFILRGNSSIRDYDFRCLRSYFKDLSTRGNE